MTTCRGRACATFDVVRRILERPISGRDTLGAAPTTVTLSSFGFGQDVLCHEGNLPCRLGESLEKDSVAVPVTGDLRMAVVGSPAYFRTQPKPGTPQDLRKHRCINFRPPTAGSIYKWEFENGRRKMEVAVDGPLVFDDEEMVLAAALGGMGLAFVIEHTALAIVKSGVLMRVLDDWCQPFPRFFLYYPGRRQQSPALAAFVDAVRVPAPVRRNRTRP